MYSNTSTTGVKGLLRHPFPRLERVCVAPSMLSEDINVFDYSVGLKINFDFV